MKSKLLNICIIIFLGNCSLLMGQSSFTIEVVPKTMDQIPPLHSFVQASHDGKWLIIGGRTNNEDNTFSVSNYQLLVIDPLKQQTWSAPVNDLLDNINTPEHLAACFANYYQDEDLLYITGGYGYDFYQMKETTFPYLTVINVPEVIKGIIANEPTGAHFQQIENEVFATNDGLLTKIENRFYLIGNNHLSGLSEEAKMAKPLRKMNQQVITFSIFEKTKGIAVSEVDSFSFDDFVQSAGATFVPQIFPDQNSGLTVFQNSGDPDHPKLIWMNVFDIGYALQADTDLHLPHYQSTAIPIYDTTKNNMHTLFFGGCDDYLCTDEQQYDSIEVDQITLFNRDETSQTEITQQTIQPFVLQGRGPSFILNTQIPHYSNGVIKYEAISAQRSLIGWLYGGASAPSPMIFNDGTFLDQASPQFFEVYLIKEGSNNSLSLDYSKVNDQILVIHVPN